MLDCPKCRIAISDGTASDVETGVCPKCRYQYLSWTGKLRKRSSRQVTLHRKTKSHPGSYERAYELRIDLPSGAREIFEFKIPGKDDVVQVRNGDEISVIFTSRDGAREDLVQVVNRTTSSVFRIGSPGRTARGLVGCLSFVAFVLSAIAASVLGASPEVVFLIAGAVFLGSLYGFARLLSLKVKKDSTLAVVAREGSDILAKKRILEQEMREHESDRRRWQVNKDRLDQLRLKIESVEEQVYQTRLEALIAASARLGELIALDDELIRVIMYLTKPKKARIFR